MHSDAKAAIQGILEQRRIERDELVPVLQAARQQAQEIENRLIRATIAVEELEGILEGA